MPTRCQNAINKLLPRDLSILVFVNASEEVHNAGLLVIHPAHVLFSPYVKIKVGKLFELKRERQPVRPTSVYEKKYCKMLLAYNQLGLVQFLPLLHLKFAPLQIITV